MEKDFLETIIEATGLPSGLIRNEIKLLADEQGLDYNQLSLEDVRKLMVSYLQKEILKNKKKYS